MPGCLLVIGSANIDFVMNTLSVPEAGETIVTKGKYAFVPGGKGANAAVTAARLGGNVVFCTRLGDDAYGDRLARIYAENGIDCKFVRIDENEQTGLAAVMVEPSGQNRIIVYPGANKNIKEYDVEASFTCHPSLVLSNLEIPEQSVIFMSNLCKIRNIPFVLDCGGISPTFDLSKLAKVDILSPNETETYKITGIMPTSLDDCLKACLKLCSMTDVRYVVLKRGERGSYIYDGKYCQICGPYEVAAVDTTAAGDAFTAAMAVEYMRNGNDLYAACRYGNAAGALTVTKRGALTSLPTRTEVEAFMANNTHI